MTKLNVQSDSSLTKALALCMVLLTFLLAQSVKANTWDVNADFSVMNGNPNGAWSYGYSFDASSGYAFYLYDSSTPTDDEASWGGEAWRILNSPTPSFTYNPHDYAVNGTLPAKTGYLHPGSYTALAGYENAYSICRWTAPADGSYKIGVSFLGCLGATVDVEVIHNTTDVLFSGIQDSSYDSDFKSLLAGDTIDFLVGNGGDNGLWDGVPIIATINSIPEPSTFVLLSAGTIGLFAYVWRRRRHAM